MVSDNVLHDLNNLIIEDSILTTGSYNKNIVKKRFIHISIEVNFFRWLMSIDWTGHSLEIR